MEYAEITSRRNSIVVEAAKLSEKKQRDEAGLFCAEGFKLFEEAACSGLPIKRVFFTREALSKYGGIIEKSACSELYLVSGEVYQKLSLEKAPQGIFFCLEKPQIYELTDSEAEKGGFIILDCVQNPLNLGAVIRSAYSLGFEKIILTDGCADAFGPKTARAAMGSLFKTRFYRVPRTCDAARILTDAKVRVICTRLDSSSKRLGEFSFTPTDSIIIGNEGHGTDEKTARVCSDSLFIPMIAGAESLNAAAAAAIVMWEMKKGALLS